jgi:hypothetical protein
LLFATLGARRCFREGKKSTKKIDSLPTIGLGAKGVGSVIERAEITRELNVNAVVEGSVCKIVQLDSGF